MEMDILKEALDKLRLETEYLKYSDELLKNILLILRPVITKLTDTDFNLLIVLLREDLSDPTGKKRGRSYALEIYGGLEHIIKKYEHLLDNKKAQQTSFLTRKETIEVLTYIRDFLKQKRFKDKIILKDTDGYFETVPSIPNKRHKRTSLRQYALERGLDYEKLRALLRRYPLLANEITKREIRGRKILYDIGDSSPLLSDITELFKGYQSSKSIYSMWIKLLKKEKGLTKSGATKWIQRKTRNGIVPPEFFYCKTYLHMHTSEKSLMKLFYKIDRSINKPVIPKKQWKQKNERAITCVEITETLEEFERVLVKFEDSRIIKAKDILENFYVALGIPPKTYRPLISQLLSSG